MVNWVGKRERGGKAPFAISTTMVLRVLMIGILIGGMLPAQDRRVGIDQQDRARAAMQASLEKQRTSALQQRTSVERQMEVAHQSAGIPSSTGYFIPMDAQYVVIQPISVPLQTMANSARWDIPSVAASLASVLPPSCPPLSDGFLTPLISAAAQTYQLDPALVREVARQESAFRPCSVSSKGAQGLMQLMPATQRMLEVNNPFDPQENIFAGAHLLSTLLERYGGNLALALSAYNAGTSRVDAIGGIPRIPETQSYVSDILRRLGTLPE